MPHHFDALMFDLDGTLADTLRDIAGGGNHMLATLGLPTLPVDRYRHLAGQGAPWLVEHALGPEHGELATRGLALFKAFQLEHGLDHTAPYPGIAELLDECRRRGLKTAVLSNKPHPATLLAVQRVLGRWRFDAVLGHEPDGPLKPDPAGALAIADRLAVPPAHWLYLGDTRVDMLTGKAAGMFTVGALWGFRQQTELLEAGADAIVAHPREVVEMLT
ncbi:MAG: HAD family hydrolase [Phycisphaeraceae bacterium]